MNEIDKAIEDLIACAEAWSNGENAVLFADTVMIAITALKARQDDGVCPELIIEQHISMDGDYYETQYLYCGCGHEVKEEQKYCDECGQKLLWEQESNHE